MLVLVVDTTLHEDGHALAITAAGGQVTSVVVARRAGVPATWAALRQEDRTPDPDPAARSVP